MCWPFTKKRLKVSLAKTSPRPLSAPLTREIENSFTKKEIINLCLNRIYFGRDVWGVENAARPCFGKDASGITLCEAGARPIASMPKPG